MPRTALRHETAESATTFHEVLDALVVGSGMEVGSTVRVGLQHLVRNRNFETIAELLEVVEGQLLHLVGSVAARKVSTKIVTFNSAGKHHGRRSLELRSRLVGVVDLAVVVTATA